MRVVQTPLRRLLGRSAIGLHGGALAAVLAVPAVAVLAALRGLPELGDESTTGVVRRVLLLLGNTAVVSAIATGVATALGGVLGLLIARTDMPGRRLVAAAMVLAACLPVYVSVVFVFAAVPIWTWAGSARACGVLHGLICTPLATLILAVAYRSADRELEDLARLDAGEWSVLWRVTIPQATWGFVAVALLIIVIVATDYTIADLLVVRTFAEEVYTQYLLSRSAAGPVATGLPVLAVLAGLLIVVQVRYGLFGEQSPWRLGGRPRTVRLGRWRWPTTALCLGSVLALAGPPAVALLKRIESADGLTSAVRGLWPELLVSAGCASISATIAVALSVGLAWTLLRARRLRWVVAAAVVLLLAMPAPVAGISLITILNRPLWGAWLYDTPAAIVAGYVVRFLPIGVLLLLPGIKRVPIEHELAARVDGCDWLGVQWHVYWPAVARDALVAWLVVMILCFGEVGSTVLLAPPGWPPAAVRAFTLLHFGVYRDLAVLALALVVCVAVPWLALLAVMGDRLRRAQD
jgi:iron(III) transport system permease protein